MSTNAFRPYDPKQRQTLPVYNPSPYIDLLLGKLSKKIHLRKNTEMSTSRLVSKPFNAIATCAQSWGHTFDSIFQFFSE